MSDSKVQTASSYAFYWKIWGALLVLTLGMIFVDQLGMPRWLLLPLLLGAMLAKAGLIASYFMHLRYERVFLRLSVLIGLLINGTILFLLIVPDAWRVLELAGS